MANHLSLHPGKTYEVIQEFMDHDRRVHPIGEQWIFRSTNFLPYEDGLTLHVELSGIPGEVVYRLQWRPDEQGQIIENFRSYVKEL